MSFINFSQPYVFTELLDIPLEEQGTLAGRLTFLQEIVLLVLLAPVGALSDKFGRKPLYVAAFVLLALAYFVYPLAGGLFMLFMFRMIFAAGAAGNIVMLPSVANDYSQEQSRAKMIAGCFIFNGLGLVLILAVLRNVPARLQESGIDAALAGQYWLWMMAGICLTVAAVIAIGLKPGAPQQLGKREPILATFKIGLEAARNPRIALAYAAAGVSRGDLSVMSSFFSLWLFQVGMDQGLSSADAQAKAGTFYIIVQAFALPGAPLAGFILDRIDRVKGLTVAMAI
ncbi:MAG: MFS transporter, partial [Gammaproteobacteria bacterium]|nr:MFS transporter [Gammaproteobacteria bacterium]